MSNKGLVINVKNKVPTEFTTVLEIQHVNWLGHAYKKVDKRETIKIWEKTGQRKKR